MLMFPNGWGMGGRGEYTTNEASLRGIGLTDLKKREKKKKDASNLFEDDFQTQNQVSLESQPHENKK